MDRIIVYPACIPLAEDHLNGQRNAAIGLGRLAGGVWGERVTSAGGLLCTPGAGLSVTIAPGQIIAPGEVDATAYGVLAADSDALPVQYLLSTATSLTVPSAGAAYTVYATLSTADTGGTVLPFYNSSNPSQTFAGADNDGAALPTIRSNVVNVAIGTSVPSGGLALWVVNVPPGATTITADMISQAAGSPFYLTIPEISALLGTIVTQADVVLRLTGTNTIGVENLGWDATDDVLVATDTGGAVHTVLPSAQRAITNGTATDFGDQKELNFYIGEISGSGTQISFPESFTALPTINLTPTSETGTNLAITVNVVKGSLTNSGVLVNINNGPATASTAGCGLWVRAFGAK